MAGQVASYVTTLLFVQAVMQVAPDDLYTHIPSLAIALLLEYLLAKGKEIVLIDRSFADPLGLFCIVIDTVFNGGGLWGAVQHLDKAASWKMLSEGLQVSSAIQPTPAMIISVAGGFVLSIAPHLLWIKK